MGIRISSVLVLLAIVLVLSSNAVVARMQADDTPSEPQKPHCKDCERNNANGCFEVVESCDDLSWFECVQVKIKNFLTRQSISKCYHWGMEA